MNTTDCRTVEIVPDDYINLIKTGKLPCTNLLRYEDGGLEFNETADEFYEGIYSANCKPVIIFLISGETVAQGDMVLIRSTNQWGEVVDKSCGNIRLESGDVVQVNPGLVSKIVGSSKPMKKAKLIHSGFIKKYAENNGWFKIVKVVQNLTFNGYLVFRDPVEEDVVEILEIEEKMIV